MLNDRACLDKMASIKPQKEYSADIRNGDNAAYLAVKEDIHYALRKEQS